MVKQLIIQCRTEILSGVLFSTVEPSPPQCIVRGPELPSAVVCFRYNLMPLTRGSAACGLLSVHALLLVAGWEIPEPPPKGTDRLTPRGQRSDSHPPPSGQIHTHRPVDRFTATAQWTDSQPPPSGQIHTHRPEVRFTHTAQRSDPHPSPS